MPGLRKGLVGRNMAVEVVWKGNGIKLFVSLEVILTDTSGRERSFLPMLWYSGCDTKCPLTGVAFPLFEERGPEGVLRKISFDGRSVAGCWID